MKLTESKVKLEQYTWMVSTGCRRSRVKFDTTARTVAGGHSAEWECKCAESDAVERLKDKREMKSSRIK